MSERRDVAAKEDAMMEALGILQEECSEVIKEVSKVRRSGPAFKPFGGPATNMDNLRDEVMDVLSILRLAGLLHLTEEHFEKKCEKLRKWSDIMDPVKPTMKASAQNDD